MSPDPANPSALIRHEDVLLHYSAADDGETIVAFKAKPTSTPKMAPVKRTTTATLDTLGTLLANEAINPGQRARVQRVGDVSSLILRPDSFFPGDPTNRPVDIPAALHKAQDQGKTTAKKSTFL